MFTRIMFEVANGANLLNLYKLAPGASPDIWAPVNNLKTILLAGLGSVGVIVLIVGIVQFATAWVAHDTSQKISAIMVFMAGALLTSASVIISVLTGTPS